MAQTFHENFRQKGSDQEKYNEGWEHVFGKKKREKCDCLDVYSQAACTCGINKTEEKSENSSSDLR